MPRSTLLVIDDEPNILTTLRRALDLEGYGVEVAGSGRLGLHKLDECDIDLVLLDVMMPERSRSTTSTCRPTRCSARSAAGSSSR